MKVSVIHDAQGRIISLSRPEEMKKVGGFLKVAIVLEPGHRMIELDLSKELEGKPLVEIHRDYQLDLRKQRLVKIKEFPVPDREHR